MHGDTSAPSHDPCQQWTEGSSTPAAAQRSSAPNCTTRLPVPHGPPGPEDSLSFWGCPGLTNAVGAQQTAAAATSGGGGDAVPSAPPASPLPLREQQLSSLASTDEETEMVVIHLSGSSKR